MSSGSIQVPPASQQEGKAGEARTRTVVLENTTAMESALQRVLHETFEEKIRAERLQHPLPIYPPGRAMHLYREIFFAGFPCLTPHESSYKDVPGGLQAVADTVVYHEKSIHAAFHVYGRMDRFFYDRQRGFGYVVYNRGEDAESCFLSLNNAVVPGPVGDPRITGPQEVTTIGFGTYEDGVPTGSNGNRRVKNYVITCEFARCLPFVTPYLLLKNEFNSLELSRSLMRHFPVPECAAGAMLGEWFSAAWVQLSEVKGANTNSEAAPGPEKHVLIGPVFDDTIHDLCNPIYRASFGLLCPTAFAKRRGTMLQLIDQWWEYYNLYILHKTEPTLDRIKSKREFLSATCATVAQEIVSLNKDSWERNAHIESASPNSLLRRLVFDDVYHCTLNSIIMKQKFKLDPAFASYMRDVFSEATIKHSRAYLKAHPFKPNPDTMRLLRQIESTLAQADRGNDEVGLVKRRCFTVEDEKAIGKWKKLTEVDDDDGEEGGGNGNGNGNDEDSGDARAAIRADIEYSLHPKVRLWMSTPLLEVAANVVENVKFLRRVKKGHIGPDGKEIPFPPRRPEDELAYPGMSLKQEDEDLFDEITTNLDGFCADGSLFSLLLLGEDPASFHSGSGHLGYEEAVEYHDKRNVSFWKNCKIIGKAMIVPIVLIACVVMVVNYIAVREPAGRESAVVDPLWRGVDATSRHAPHDGDGEHRRVRKSGTPAASAAEMKDKTPEEIAEARRQAAKSARELMRRAKNEAAKRGAKFNISLSADL